MLSTPLLADNFFPTDLYNKLCDMAETAPFAYGSKSNSRTDPYGHLAWKPVHDQSENLADLTYSLPSLLYDALVWLKKKTTCDWKDNWKLVRCYVNGYTYGMDGYFHRDSERAGEVTVIVFLCKEWYPDWAGENVVISDDWWSKQWSTMPRPNRAVVLPSNMLHCGRAVSRNCPEMRKVLVFKMRPARTEEFERQSGYLSATKALQMKHGSGGSLHDHLMRVHQLLADEHCSTTICFGGGLHSVYGTNSFKERLFEPTAYYRNRLAIEFGRYAEELAHLFSILDRPVTLEAVAPYFGVDKPVGDPIASLACSYNNNITLSVEMARDLCLIECANLADQKSLHKWPNLQRMWREK